MTIVKFKKVETEEICYGVLAPNGIIWGKDDCFVFPPDKASILDAYEDDFENEIRLMGGWL